MCVMDEKPKDFKLDKDGNWIYIPTGKKLKIQRSEELRSKKEILSILSDIESFGVLDENMHPYTRGVKNALLYAIKQREDCYDRVKRV